MFGTFIGDVVGSKYEFNNQIIKKQTERKLEFAGEPLKAEQA